MHVKQRIVEKRREKRYELNEPVKARLYVSPQGNIVDVSVVNISRSGISVSAAVKIPEASTAHLILNGQQYRLIAAWELPGVAPKDSSTYGFACARKNVDLVRAFAAAGLPIANAKEKFQTDEERFVEAFDTIEFEAFPAAGSKP